jgi:serine/threonine protein kinase
MTPERWRQVDRLLQAALERDLSERSSFLNEACRGDETLRKEVESLLATDEQAHSFLKSPALERAAPLLDDGKSNSMFGRRIGYYQIISQLGAGGMGEVYLAQDTRLGRKVAIKLLPSYFTKDQQRLSRFQQEARAASGLNHPNIITIFEIGQVDSIHFIASEHIQGETLRGVLSRRKMVIDDVLDVAIQTASALGAAHEAGIVHRDVKPENIMLRPDGYVKVLDFGLAKLTEKQTTSTVTEAPTVAKVETDPGTVMGTASYMSPEQSRGQDVDARSDIWSLGVVLYEMITGRMPFEGETPSDIIAAVLDKQPSPLARFAPEAPAQAQWISNNALRKERNERYQTVKEMLSDLRELKRELDAQAHMERSITPALESVNTGGTGAPTSAHAPTISVAQSVHTGDAAPIQTSPAAHTTSSAEYIISEIKRHKTSAFLCLLAACIVIGATGFGIYKFFNRPGGANRAAPFQIGKVTRLTTSGKVSNVVALSPDGKLFAYALYEGEKQSLWLGHVDGGTRVQIHSPINGVYLSLTFAPDGSSLYYTLGENYSQGENQSNGALYKLPVFGGAPEKIRDNVRNRITFAPDGKEFAFVRIDPTGKAALVVADTDGANEHEIARPPDKRNFAWHSPSWSPDGATIALGASVNDNDSSYEVLIVNVADHAMKRLTSYGWSRVESVTWRRDGGALIVAATVRNSVSRQLWSVSYPDGDTQRMVTDLTIYGYSVSLSADNHSLLTIQTQNQSDIWVAPAGDLSQAKQVTFSSLGRQNGYHGLDWTPDGRIVYTARADEGWTIWITNADGSEQRQLIPTGGLNYIPSVTSDARYLVFQSNRNGKYAVWRANLDGGEMRQLTDADIAAQPDVSPDGKWIVYVSSREVSTNEDFGTLYRISIDGGEARRMTEKPACWVRISPDSRFAACGYEDDGRTKLAILPIEGGEPLKLFDVPRLANFRLGIRWTADGKAVTYRDWVNGIWKQDLSGGAAERVAGLPQEKLFGYGWSRDGRLFAFTRGVDTRDVILLTSSR